MPGQEVSGWLAHERDYPSIERLLAIIWQTIHSALGGGDLPHLEGKWLGRTSDSIESDRNEEVLSVVKGMVDVG